MIKYLYVIYSMSQYVITKTVYTECFTVNNHNDSLCSCTPEDETMSALHYNKER